MGAIGFSVGNKGYLGTGGDFSGGAYYDDLWEYNPVTDSWTQKANLPGPTRYRAVAYGVGSKGYVGTGYSGAGYNDWWEYDPAGNTWLQKANMGSFIRYGATGFVLGNNIYCGTGYNGSAYTKDFWVYNTVTNIWTQKADYGGQPIIYGTGFAVGAHGYIGTGVVLTPVQTAVNDIWQYDTTTNIWTQKASLTGGIRSEAVGFSVSGYGYIATGTSDWGIGALDDCWRYDPINDTWTAVASFPGGPREEATAFVIDCNAYVGTGFVNDNGSTLQNDFWAYSDCSGLPSASLMSSDTSICAGSCIDFFDLSAYTPFAWQWSFPGSNMAFSVLQNPTGICYANPGTYDVSLIVCNAFGCDTITFSNFITVSASPVVNLGNDTVLCNGATLLLQAGSDPQYSYLWQDLSTDSLYLVNGTGTYWVEVGNNGCNVYDTVVVTTIPCSTPLVSFASSDTILCEKNCIDFFDLSTNNPNQWQWYFNGAQPATSSLQNPTGICYNNYGTYPVTLVASNANGSDSVTITTFITVIQSPPAPQITVNVDTLFSTPASAYQWYFGNVLIPGATGSYYVYSMPGYYFVIISDSNGCQSASNIFDLTAVNDLNGVNPFSIQPNPASDELTIQLNPVFLSDKIHFGLTNLLGERVWGLTLSATGAKTVTIPTATFSNGVYYLLLDLNGKQWREPILIRHP